MIYTQKAAVLYNNVWRGVTGTMDRATADFIFVLNARIERVAEGQWRSYPKEYNDSDLECEVISLNINGLIRKTPKPNRVRR